MNDPRWLDDDQQRDWRAYIDGTLRLHALLDHDLKIKHGLLLPEYEILVRLSESRDHALRMAQLAELTSQSRSRLSHTCARLETKGLIHRETCPNDRRGIYARLTAKGLTVLENAARDHVETVRAYFVDIINPADLNAIGRALTKVSDRITRSGKYPMD